MRQFSANQLGADPLGGLAASGPVGILGLIEGGLPPAPRAVTRVLVEATPGARLMPLASKPTTSTGPDDRRERLRCAPGRD